MFLQLLGSLTERLGVKAAAVLLIGAGLFEILPIVFPAYVVHGVVYIGAGIGLLAFGQRVKKAQDQFITSEAEKRIASPTLPTSSTVPAIQKEIETQLANPTTAAVSNGAGKL